MQQEYTIYERTDWLAGSTTPFGELELTQVDLLHKALEGIREQDYEDTT
jgi:hypothetical protein